MKWWQNPCPIEISSSQTDLGENQIASGWQTFVRMFCAKCAFSRAKNQPTGWMEMETVRWRRAKQQRCLLTTTTTTTTEKESRGYFKQITLLLILNQHLCAFRMKRCMHLCLCTAHNNSNAYPLELYTEQIYTESHAHAYTGGFLYSSVCVCAFAVSTSLFRLPIRCDHFTKWKSFPYVKHCNYASPGFGLMPKLMVLQYRKWICGFTLHTNTSQLDAHSVPVCTHKTHWTLYKHSIISIYFKIEICVILLMLLLLMCYCFCFIPHLGTLCLPVNILICVCVCLLLFLHFFLSCHFCSQWKSETVHLKAIEHRWHWMTTHFKHFCPLSLSLSSSHSYAKINSDWNDSLNFAFCEYSGMHYWNGTHITVGLKSAVFAFTFQQQNVVCCVFTSHTLKSWMHSAKLPCSAHGLYT